MPHCGQETGVSGSDREVFRDFSGGEITGAPEAAVFSARSFSSSEEREAQRRRRLSQARAAATAIKARTLVSG